MRIAKGRYSPISSTHAVNFPPGTWNSQLPASNVNTLNRTEWNFLPRPRKDEHRKSNSRSRLKKPRRTTKSTRSTRITMIYESSAVMLKFTKLNEQNIFPKITSVECRELFASSHKSRLTEFDEAKKRTELNSTVESRNNTTGARKNE